MDNVNTCLLCRHTLQEKALHLGRLPPCNQFQTEANASVGTASLSITLCKSCGLIQLMKLPKIDTLIPTTSWIQYNEPEGHLDDLVSKLISYLEKKDVVYSTSPFDTPLSLRLKQKNISCVDAELLTTSRQNNATGKFPYLETIQTYLNTSFLSTFSLQKGRGKAVTCRYLLEHCHDPLHALTSLRHIIMDDGFILIEVPDSIKFLERKDYSFIWEEHVTYFTEDSLTRLLKNSGYHIVQMIRYEGTLEDALVAIAKPNKQSTPRQNDVFYSENIIELFENYTNSFSFIKKKYHELFASIKNNNRKIVIFGAGHQAIMFINALDISSYISCVIDDDKNKQQYYLPGSGIPIVDSSQLLTDSNIDLCLLAINPNIEEKIKKKFDSFLQRGGAMHSIFSNQVLANLAAI